MSKKFRIGYKMVTLGKKRAFHRGKAKAFNLSKLLVPEVGIEPTWAWGPRDFESENRLFANPLILKTVSLNLLTIPGKNFSSLFHSILSIPIFLGLFYHNFITFAIHDFALHNSQ